MLLIGRKVCQKGRLLWDKSEFAGMGVYGEHECKRRVKSQLKTI